MKTKGVIVKLNRRLLRKLIIETLAGEPQPLNEQMSLKQVVDGFGSDDQFNELKGQSTKNKVIAIQQIVGAKPDGSWKTKTDEAWKSWLENAVKEVYSEAEQEGMQDDVKSATSNWKEYALASKGEYEPNINGVLKFIVELAKGNAKKVAAAKKAKADDKSADAVGRIIYNFRRKLTGDTGYNGLGDLPKLVRTNKRLSEPLSMNVEMTSFKLKNASTGDSKFVKALFEPNSVYESDIKQLASTFDITYRDETLIRIKCYPNTDDLSNPDLKCNASTGKTVSGATVKISTVDSFTLKELMNDKSSVAVKTSKVTLSKGGLAWLILRVWLAFFKEAQHGTYTYSMET